MLHEFFFNFYCIPVTQVLCSYTIHYGRIYSAVYSYNSEINKFKMMWFRLQADAFNYELYKIVKSDRELCRDVSTSYTPMHRKDIVGATVNNSFFESDF